MNCLRDIQTVVRFTVQRRKIGTDLCRYGCKVYYFGTDLYCFRIHYVTISH